MADFQMCRTITFNRLAAITVANTDHCTKVRERYASLPWLTGRHQWPGLCRKDCFREKATIDPELVDLFAFTDAARGSEVPAVAAVKSHSSLPVTKSVTERNGPRSLHQTSKGASQLAVGNDNPVLTSSRTVAATQRDETGPIRRSDGLVQ